MLFEVLAVSVTDGGAVSRYGSALHLDEERDRFSRRNPEIFMVRDLLESVGFGSRDLKRLTTQRRGE